MIKKALVTGSDGFIGSHLVESLVKDGIHVKAFCFYNSNNSWGWLDTLPNEIKDSLEIFLGDVRYPFCVKKAMKGCDTVFHLAALIGIPYSYISPKSYIDTNIHGTLNIVQAARELEIKNEDLPYEDRDHALFVAFAPYKDPRYAISVVIEHGGSGSKTAAPIAKKVIKKVLDRHPLRESQANGEII